MNLQEFQENAGSAPPPRPSTPSTGYPSAGNPGTNVRATRPGPFWFHQISESMRLVLVAAGYTPSSADLTQLRESIKRLGQFERGTKLAFLHGVVPTGWERDVSLQDTAIRLDSRATPGTTGGTAGFAASLASTTATTDATVLTVAQMPAHDHYLFSAAHQTFGAYRLSAATRDRAVQVDTRGAHNEPAYTMQAVGPNDAGATLGKSSTTGDTNNQGHTHAVTVRLNAKYVNAMVCTKQ